MDARSIIVLVIGLVSVITNGILMVILFLDPLKKFRTSTNYLIISLTISDFLTGAAGCAFAFDALKSSLVLFGMLWSTILSSFMTIFLMSCERFVIVLHPLRARSLITKHRVFVSIALNWMVSSIIGVLLGHGRMRQHIYYLTFVLFSCILAMVLVLIGIYLVIILTMMGKAKFQRQTICSRGRSIIRQEQRLTGVLILLVTILLLTVVPYVANNLTFSAYCIFGSPEDVPKNLRYFATYYFPVELLNFAVNPIIYAWRLPNYRKSLVYYLLKLPFISKKLDARPEQKTRSMLAEETL